MLHQKKLPSSLEKKIARISHWCVLFLFQKVKLCQQLVYESDVIILVNNFSPSTFACSFKFALNA